MSLPLKLAVLVSVGRNPISGAARASRNDVLALDLANTLAPAPLVLHAGDPAQPALQDYLAYGATSLEVLPVPVGADALPPLAQRLGGCDLVLCGDSAEAGEGSGLLPYLLAKALNVPVVTAALELSLRDGEVEIVQFLPKGKRRVVRVVLPAVIAVHKLAPRRPLYVHSRRRSGRIVCSSVALPPAPVGSSPWRLEPARKMPQRLAPPETRQGHTRMLAAIAMESRSGTLISEGDADAKARAILAYLRGNRLIYV